MYCESQTLNLIYKRRVSLFFFLLLLHTCNQIFMSEICPVNLKMSSSHKRQSLSQGPFEGLNMDNESEHLGRSIRLMMLSTFSKPKFTIKMDDAYDYNILQETPDQLHHELRKYT